MIKSMTQISKSQPASKRRQINAETNTEHPELYFETFDWEIAQTQTTSNVVSNATTQADIKTEYKNIGNHVDYLSVETQHVVHQNDQNTNTFQVEMADFQAVVQIQPPTMTQGMSVVNIV